MVAKTIELPNIRKFFIPDPGHEIADADLSGADAQVVAWEAEDEDLKNAFRKGLKLHIKNARDVFPEKTRGLSDDALKAQDHPGGLYYACKRGVHGTNYGGKARTISAACGWTIHETELFQRRWFSIHPGIKAWHTRTERLLQGIQCWRCWSLRCEKGRCLDCNTRVGRTVGNKFGYRRVYFDRIESVLPEALAWVPQSTVAVVTEQGMCNVDENLPWVELLLQVHDSTVFQYPIPRRKDLGEVLNQLTVPVPYDDPLVIPWGLATSRKSWGDVQPAEWKLAA